MEAVNLMFVAQAPSVPKIDIEAENRQNFPTAEGHSPFPIREWGRFLTESCKRRIFSCALLGPKACHFAGKLDNLLGKVPNRTDLENIWWTWSGSNRRPLPCHGSALPAAPQAHCRRECNSFILSAPLRFVKPCFGCGSEGIAVASAILFPAGSGWVIVSAATTLALAPNERSRSG